MAIRALEKSEVWCGIVSNGIPQACIVLGTEANQVEQFAAQELQRYLKKITGAELPITRLGGHRSKEEGQILIGGPQSNVGIRELIDLGAMPPLGEANLGFDGYLIKAMVRDGHPLLVLGSHNPRGALFAVYDFLESYLGVRFFGFGESGELLPKQSSIALQPAERLLKPDYRFRIANNNNFEATNDQMLRKVVDWSVKNRFNTFLIGVDEVAQMAMDEFSKRGMEVWGGGHLWSQFTPAKTFFVTHPEWFPLINGKRTFTGDKRTITFCYSNPDAMRMFVTNACAYARKRPVINVFACWQEDGPQNWAQCQCDGCKQFSFSDWNLFIVNQLAKAFEVDPLLKSVRLQWIAYNEGSVPPRQVIPYNQGKQIDLFYANGSRDYLNPMDSDSNRKCATWLARDEARKQINTDFKLNPTDDDLAGYQRLDAMLSYLKKADYRGHISVLEFVNGHIGYWLDLPYMQHVQTGPWPENIFSTDMQFYLSQGVVGWSDCFDWPNDVPDPFWNRVVAQVLWNVQVDVASIREDFYNRYYGAIGPSMNDYFLKAWRILHQEMPRPTDYLEWKSLRHRLIEARSTFISSVHVSRLEETIVWHDSIRFAAPSANVIKDGGFESISLGEGRELFPANTPWCGTGKDWCAVRPKSTDSVRPAEGKNYLRVLRDDFVLSQTSQHYVFEAETVYKLEADVLAASASDSISLAVQMGAGVNGNSILVHQTVTPSHSNAWQHVVAEWQCRSGAEEEGKPICMEFRGAKGSLIDNVVLRAKRTKPASPGSPK